MRPFPPPMKISPTIKMFRWSLLVLGMAYGYARRTNLLEKEDSVRVIAFEEKRIRDIEAAEKRRRDSDRDIAMLASLADSS